jgi:hypothetical protein
MEAYSMFKVRIILEDLVSSDFSSRRIYRQGEWQLNRDR